MTTCTTCARRVLISLRPSPSALRPHLPAILLRRNWFRTPLHDGPPRFLERRVPVTSWMQPLPIAYSVYPLRSPILLPPRDSVSKVPLCALGPPRPTSAATAATLLLPADPYVTARSYSVVSRSSRRDLDCLPPAPTQPASAVCRAACDRPPPSRPTGLTPCRLGTHPPLFILRRSLYCFQYFPHRLRRHRDLDRPRD